MKNSINWFEIPVLNFERAKTFYEALYGAPIHETPFPEGRYGMLPCDMANGVGGGIAQYEGFKPGVDGALIYLNGGEDLSVPLSKIEAAGGKIILPKTAIGPNGFMAHFIDTEGNKVALHSMK
jgi:uncharacterized protein